MLAAAVWEFQSLFNVEVVGVGQSDGIHVNKEFCLFISKLAIIPVKKVVLAIIKLF